MGTFPSLIPVAGGWPFPAPHRLAQAQVLSGQAKRAELYREEVEALRERAGRLLRLQEELRRCHERLQVAEACKSQLEVRRGRGPERAGPEAGPGGGACWGWGARQGAKFGPRGERARSGGQNSIGKKKCVTARRNG